MQSLNAEHNTGECEQNNIPYLMNSHLNLKMRLNYGSNDMFMWSNCSKNSITSFLEYYHFKFDFLF